MFSSLFYLLLILLLISIGGGSPLGLIYEEKPLEAFLVMLALYFGMLSLFFWQNRVFKQFCQRHKERMAAIANVVAIGFFVCFYFVFGAQRVFEQFQSFSRTLSAVFSICLYFGAMAVFYFAQENNRLDALRKTGLQICFLIPFAIPFLLYVFLSDMAMAFPLDRLRSIAGIHDNSTAESIIQFALAAGFFLLTLILLPRLMIIIWGCRSLKDLALNERLEEICRKAGFKHDGIKVLPVLPEALTAAIVGISGCFRYIMFTQALLDRLSPSSIEAVLAHEVGHSQRRHLLLYPLILCGAAIFAELIFEYAYDPVSRHLMTYGMVLSTPWKEFISSLGMFLFFVTLMGIYVRFVFGYFSRLFERQADLHVFELDLPVQHMMDALHEIAVYSGYTHHVPSWHHYSIQERIDFLQTACKDRSVVKKHHRKVLWSLAAYFAIVILAIFSLL